MALTVVEAARSLWCPGIVQVTGNPNNTLHNWLQGGNYAPAVTAHSLVLNGINNKEYLDALAADINRLSSAASETLQNIVEVEAVPKSLGWPYVKLYYASLFYMHVLLRVWGRSPSYFRTLELMRLRQIVSAYGITSSYRLQTGQYILAADLTNSSVEISPDNSGGGAHESLWREASKAFVDFRAKVAAGPYLAADKQSLDSQIKAMQALITNNNSSVSWLSAMRNDIQYRQAEGVWYPYKTKAKTGTLQIEVGSLVNGDTNFVGLIGATGDDLVIFRSACKAIICFVREVLADLEQIGGAKSFLKHGQRKFEDATIVSIPLLA